MNATIAIVKLMDSQQQLDGVINLFLATNEKYEHIAKK